MLDQTASGEMGKQKKSGKKTMEEKVEEVEKAEAQEEASDVEELKATENADAQEEAFKELEEDKVKKELEEFKKKYFYLAAEMENARKRNERERERLVKFANEKVISEMTDVLENLARTVDAIKGDEDEKVQNILSGVDMVRKQFVEIMEKNGCTQVESLGKIFDPNFHEAMASTQAEGKQENEIVTVYQNGYVLNGRLLKAAKVVIAKNN